VARVGGRDAARHVRPRTDPLTCPGHVQDRCRTRRIGASSLAETTPRQPHAKLHRQTGLSCRLAGWVGTDYLASLPQIGIAKARRSRDRGRSREM